MGLPKWFSLVLPRNWLSVFLRLRKRQRKKMAPTRAQKPTTPTTTPAAMAAVLGLPSFFVSSLLTGAVSLAAVTTTVLPLVSVAVWPLVVEVEESWVELELELLPTVSTFWLRPVR